VLVVLGLVFYQCMGVVALPSLFQLVVALFLALVQAFLSVISIVGILLRNEFFDLHIPIMAFVLIQLFLLHSVLLLIVLELSHLVLLHLLITLPVAVVLSLVVPRARHVLSILVLLLRALTFILMIWLAFLSSVLVIHRSLPIKVQGLPLLILPASTVQLQLGLPVLFLVLKLLLLAIVVLLVVLVALLFVVLERLRLVTHVELLVIVHLLLVSSGGGPRCQPLLVCNIAHCLIIIN
jgi:hypothetical protein